MTENQQLALRLLCEHRTVAVSNFTHTGFAGREGVSTPEIAAPTAAWLVRNGYARRFRIVGGENDYDGRGPYLEATAKVMW